MNGGEICLAAFGMVLLFGYCILSRILSGIGKD